MRKVTIILLAFVTICLLNSIAFAEEYRWTYETIATNVSDSNYETSLDVYGDKVGISYFYNGAYNRIFYYAEKSGNSAWINTVLDSTGWPGGFEYSSLKFNPVSHDPQISYFKTGGNNENQVKQLKFAEFNGSSWNVNTLRTGDYPNNPSLEYNPSTNLPVIAFTENANPSTTALLKYNGQIFDKESIPNSRGRGVDLKFSNDGKAAVGFMDDGQQKLKVARQLQDNSWTIDTVDDIGTMVNLGGSHVSLQFDNNGILHAAYESSVPTGGKLKYATFNGTSWETQLLVDSQGISNANLLFNSSNNPTIAYYDGAGGGVKIAYMKNGSWNFDSIGGGYGMSNLVMDNNGSVYIAYFAYGSRDLIFAKGTPNYNINLISIPWYQNISPYNSTGAATAQMILNYVRTGTGLASLTQDEIYQYAKSPQPYGPDLNPDEMDKALGHFDPYDTLVSNWSNAYDSLPDGNPYKGYNFSVETFDPSVDTDAINKYMRDICHWMAYTVTKEDWRRDGDLVVNPNTPAAVPIYGTYSRWVIVKGFSSSANPCPEPYTNPWNTPDFTVYGFWIKDPLVPGIGQDTYKTAAECAATYFVPLSTTDSYNGKFIQVAEPPLEMSNAKVEILQPVANAGNLQFIGVTSPAVEAKALSYMASLSVTSASKVAIKKNNWSDIVPSTMLSDPDCQAAFNETRKGKPVLVKREDVENSDYYLVPFKKHVKKSGLLTSAVVILDANSGYFKEASWTLAPEKFLKINKNNAVRLIMNYIQRDFTNKLNKLPKISLKAYLKQKNVLYRNYAKLISYVNDAETQLCWKSNCDYSASPYEPYWRIDANGYIWYVTQRGKVISEDGLSVILGE